MSLTAEEQQKLDELYWNEDFSNWEISQKFDLPIENRGQASGQLWRYVTPRPVNKQCPDCGTEMVYYNRGARNRKFSKCPNDCGERSEKQHKRRREQRAKKFQGVCVQIPEKKLNQLKQEATTAKIRWALWESILENGLEETELEDVIDILRNDEMDILEGEPPITLEVVGKKKAVPTTGAMETHYANHKFRSRLEARWAVVFDYLEIDWVYEPQTYKKDDLKYLPDFWLPELGWWIETKTRDLTSLEKEKARMLLKSTKCPVFCLIGYPADWHIVCFSNSVSEDDFESYLDREGHLENALEAGTKARFEWGETPSTVNEFIGSPLLEKALSYMYDSGHVSGLEEGQLMGVIVFLLRVTMALVKLVTEEDETMKDWENTIFLLCNLTESCIERAKEYLEVEKEFLEVKKGFLTDNTMYPSAAF